MGVIDLVKGFITGVLVLVLMAALPSYIIMNAIQSNLLNQNYYETQFEKTGLYIKMHNGLLDIIASQIPKQELSTYGISESDVRSAMSKSITREWVRSEINRNIRNLMWYLNDETKGVNLSISIRPKIAEGIANMITEKIGLSQSAAIAFANELDAVKSIPDPLDMETFAPGTKTALADLKSNILMFKSAISYLLMGIIAIVALLFLLTLNLKEFAKVLGWPVLATGIILAAASFFLPNIIRETVSQMEVASSQQMLTVTNIIDFLSPIFGSILTQAAILIAVGILLVAFSFVYPMVEKKKS
ncbi:MAG: hypothetical protein N3G74_01630 [Candidatus Micrarchaeota archaeon]|nr:hypothetical protein [Candidatus Micrarchaeota archaeon]